MEQLRRTTGCTAHTSIGAAVAWLVCDLEPNHEGVHFDQVNLVHWTHHDDPTRVGVTTNGG